MDCYCLFVCATVKLAASTVADGVKCCAGCVLFEMMTKRHPFEAQDINALMKKVQTGPVRPCLALPCLSIDRKCILNAERCAMGAAPRWLGLGGWL
jgi:hypothetical protein